MKTLLLALLLAAALTPASAAEQQKRVLVGYRHHMPPAEYDVPYEGTLTIWWVSTAQQIREFCPNAEFGPAGFAMACAKRSKGDPPHKTCDVYVVKNPSYNGFKFNLEARLRHELAHCNGWGADHAGGKAVNVTVTSMMPSLPESARWLPAYPPLVCITTDRTVEPCDKRKPWWAS